MSLLSRQFLKCIPNPVCQFYRYRTTYVVLLPEVPEETNTNIFQTENGLPNFHDMTPEKCYSGMGTLCLNYESGVWSLEEKIKDGTQAKTFKGIIEHLDALDSPLTSAWGSVKSLYTVKNNIIATPSYLKIHERARKARSQKFQSGPIYQACKEIYVTDPSLDEMQKRVIQKFILEGRLNGVDLLPKQREIYRNILAKLEAEKQLYRLKLQESARRFSYRIIDINVVRDFPRNILKEMAYDKKEYLKGPWTVTHHPLVYSAFLEYCPDKDLRWNAWNAYIMRNSIHLQNELNTGLHVEEIRSKRKEQAKLLGFSSFAEMSMQTKMAGSVDKVLSVISSLHTHARLQQSEEMESLRDFANTRGHIGDLQECDVPYWRRKQMNHLYRSDPLELNSYFPFHHVWEQLLRFCSHLFDIQIEEMPRQEINIWHPDVRLYCIKDFSGERRGLFYLDPYRRPREKIVTHPDSSWMLSMWGRSKVSGTEPVASLIFNFQPPKDGLSLLSLGDVQSLFKRFGHALQHLLSVVPYGQASGLTNVEWDAVQVSSNLLQNWLYDPSVLKSISHHYQSGEQLNESQINDIVMARTHFAAYDLCRELFLSHFDLSIYSRDEFWLDTLRELWPAYLPFELDKNHSLPCWFSPIISEVWAAAYYSDIWSKMLAADAFGAFKEASSEEWPNIGKRYHDTFLSMGGGCHPSEVFRKFRGRDPNPVFLLTVLGIS